MPGFCSAETRNYDLFSSACGASGLRRLVKRHDLRRVSLQIRDARLVRRVSGEELRRLAAAELLHLLPERDRGLRVVAGARSELDADAIGFRLHAPRFGL